MVVAMPAAAPTRRRVRLAIRHARRDGASNVLSRLNVASPLPADARGSVLSELRRATVTALVQALQRGYFLRGVVVPIFGELGERSALTGCGEVEVTETMDAAAEAVCDELVIPLVHAVDDGVDHARMAKVVDDTVANDLRIVDQFTREVYRVLLDSLRAASDEQA
jgi:hypothetical protein